MSDVSYNLVMYQLTQITSDSATLLATTQRHSLHKLAFIAVAPPGFCNRGGSEVWVGGSRVRSPPEADTFTAVHREFVGFGTV